MALLPAFPDPVVIAITLRQGATFYRAYTWTVDGDPVDLTDMEVRAKVRPDFAADPSLTFAAGVLDGPAGMFFVKATPAAIAAIAVPAGLDAATRAYAVGAWDCELEDSAGDVVRLIEGDVSVSREATT